MSNEEIKLSKKSVFDVKVETCFGHIFQTCPYCTHDENNKHCPCYFPIFPQKLIKPAVTFFVNEISTFNETKAPSSISAQV